MLAPGLRLADSEAHGVLPMWPVPWNKIVSVLQVFLSIPRIR